MTETTDAKGRASGASSANREHSASPELSTDAKTKDWWEQIEAGIKNRTKNINDIREDIVEGKYDIDANDKETYPDAGSFLRAVEEQKGKKRLFVCCDGTWNNASGTVAPMTNVARLARCVDRFGKDELEYTNGVPQIVYYSAGVGTHSVLSLDSNLSGATGAGLDANILNAYCFLCNNYNFLADKDEIILVGFSRGAFTVRCLAAFINEVGLLRRRNLTFLYFIFRRWLERKELKYMLQKKIEDFSWPVEIQVLAEWDTVSAMGLPISRRERPFSFVKDVVPECVKHAFLAIALDEKRATFPPVMWKKRSENSKTIVKQCAFVGCHSDIGGGNADAGLSTISLLWMISQIKDNSGARFDEEALLHSLIPSQSSTFEEDRHVGRWPWTTPEHYIMNPSISKGRVHESLTKWWRIPYSLSLRFWHGRRDKFFEPYARVDDDDSCSLSIHSTVHILKKKGFSNVESLKHYKLAHDSVHGHIWESETPGEPKKFFKVEPLGGTKVKDGEAEKKDGEIEEKDGEAEKKDGEAEKKDGEAEKKDGEIEEKDGEAEKKDGEAEKKDGETEKELLKQWYKGTGNWKDKYWTGVIKGFSSWGLKEVPERDRVEKPLAKLIHDELGLGKSGTSSSPP